MRILFITKSKKIKIIARKKSKMDDKIIFYQPPIEVDSLLFHVTKHAQ